MPTPTEGVRAEVRGCAGNRLCVGESGKSPEDGKDLFRMDCKQPAVVLFCSVDILLWPVPRMFLTWKHCEERMAPSRTPTVPWVHRLTFFDR